MKTRAIIFYALTALFGAVFIFILLDVCFEWGVFYRLIPDPDPYGFLILLADVVLGLISFLIAICTPNTIPSPDEGQTKLA